MRVLRRRYLLVVFLLVVSGRCFLRAADWPAIDPAELQIKELPEQPGAPAFVLFREEIDDDQKQSISVYMRIKVLNEAGRKYADVEIPFFSSNSLNLSIHDLQGRTIHSDGSIVALQGKPYDKTVIKSKAIKERVKAFSLPDVQVGSILEYRYILRYDSFVIPPEWEIQDEFFARKEHFRFVPTSQPIITSHGNTRGGVSYTWKLPKGITIKDERGTYDLQLTDVPAFVREEHMPPAARYKYVVRFYYGRGGDPDQYWKEEANYWRQDVESFIGRKHGVADAVSRITSAGDTPEQKAKKIYSFVADMENSTYKPHRSEKELKALNIKNSGVEDILRQQSGDQEELTLLFVALVRAAGIPAYPMWITARRSDIFEKNFLSTDQLDSYLAVITLDNKEVYLDPGTKFCPYGLLYWDHTNAEGLKETANGAELGHTPMPHYKDAVTKRVARLALDDAGTVNGTVAVGFFGQEAVIRRIEASRTDDVGRTRLLEDEVKSWLPSNAEVTITKQPDWNNPDLPLLANFKISTPILASGGKRVLLPTNIFEFGRPAMFSHNERQYPIYLEYPTFESDDIRIKLPDNLLVESLPPNEHEKADYALYGVERKQDKNELIVAREFAIGAFFFQPTEYKALKGFYDKIKESDEQQALLKQVPHGTKN